MSITTVSSPPGWMKDINVQYWVRYQNSRERQGLRPRLPLSIFYTAVGDGLFTTHHTARISLSLFDSKMFILTLGGLNALLKLDIYSTGNTVPDLWGPDVPPWQTQHQKNENNRMREAYRKDVGSHFLLTKKKQLRSGCEVHCIVTLHISHFRM